MPNASINPQLANALLGGTFVQPEDGRANWLALQAKRQAMRQSADLNRAQVDNYESQIANVRADNDRADAAGLVQAAQAKALEAKNADVAAKKLQDDKHIAGFRLIASADPKDARGLYDLANNLRSQGVLDDEDHQGLNMTPGDKWRDVALQGIAKVGGETALKGFLDDEVKNNESKAQTLEREANARAKQAEADAKAAEGEAKKAARAKFDERYTGWLAGRKPNAALEQEFMFKEEKEAANAKQGDKQPIASIQEYEYAKANGYKGTFNEYQTMDANRKRSNITIQNHAPGLGGPAANPNLRGEDFLKTLPPATASAVRAIATGNDVMPAANARSQAAQDIRNAVYQFDPNFNVQRAQVRKAFTTGPDARNIGALNTAIVHLGRLGDVADSLNNGSFVPGNEGYNWLRDKFGSEKVTNFTLLKDAVAGEMAAALKGNATDIEITKMGKSIRDSNSPDQMKGIVDEGMGILNDKAETYNERYHAVAPDDPWSPVLPRAAVAMKSRNVGTPKAGPNVGDKKQHQGHTYMFTGKEWQLQ